MQNNTNTFDSNLHISHIKVANPNHKSLSVKLQNDNMGWYRIQWKPGKYLPRLCKHSIHLTKIGNEIIEWLTEYMFIALDCRIVIYDVFGNYYRNGKDYLPYHRDQYENDGKQLHVISLSFGESRKFRFKPDKSSLNNLSLKQLEYNLDSGDIMIFDPFMNKHFKHGIPKQTTITEGRVNFTCFVEFIDELPYGKSSTINTVTKDDDDEYNKILEESKWDF